MAPQVSIITTSYNQLSTLRLLFKSLERQTQSDFELIVADDGSTDGTLDFCKITPSFDCNLVSQPDEGYRKSRILNEAVSKSKSDYLVFIDSDVVLEKHFIEDHLTLRKTGGFVCGRRVDLGPEITGQINSKWIETGWCENPWFKLFLSSLRKDTQSTKRAFRVTSRTARGILGYLRPIDILGSNLSLWKSDLLEVNGYNEALQSYWGEDGDLFIRLRNLGKRAISGKGMCIQYHLFHPRREPTPENINLVDQLLSNKEYKWADE